MHRLLSFFILLLPIYAFSYDITVSAWQQNVQIHGARSYEIPQGTKTIELVYNIYSAEYPQFVNSQSIYNDVWTLSLISPDGAIFDITRQINSQLTQEPIWLPNKTTGDIKKIIDISSLTSNAGVTLQLAASSMNVGDSKLNTMVRASINSAPKLTIMTVIPDSIDSVNSGEFYSIPSSGSSNDLHRYVTLEIKKLSNVSLQDITVTVVGGEESMDIMSAVSIPSGGDVDVLQESDTAVNLKVRLTVQNPVSTINTEPPPGRDISYRFNLTALDDEGNEITDEKIFTGRRALWDLSSQVPGRYGARDSGGDAWGALGTYNWLQANSALINEVDDISGEHGRNIHHATHQYGTDIDTYHFYRFPNATSGTDNYNRLRAAVVSAFDLYNSDGTLKVDPSDEALAAKQMLIDFVTETRNGIDQLTDLTTVAQLYYAIGSAGSGLQNGWVRSLIRTGKTSRTINDSATVLDLGLVAWNNNSVTFNAVHNNHIHVTLRRPMIGE